MERTPLECHDMHDIRAQIDRIDRALVALLFERSNFIKRAAIIKKPQNLPAHIQSRVDEVLSNVQDHARIAGLDPTLAAEIWEKLIAWSIELEETLLAKLPSNASPEE